MIGDAGGWEGANRWADGLDRLRNQVRQHLVANQIAEVLASAPGGAGLSVLDVGCGQGTQALALARQGHAVTGLDLSDELLERCARTLQAESAAVRSRVRLIHGAGESAPQLTPGPFDLVLCHGVLMYLEDPAGMLGALTEVTAAGGRLSLLVRNGLAPAMRAGLLRRWREAIAAFDSPLYVNRLGLAARAHAPGEIDAILEPLGWRREAFFGVRVFTDALDDGARIDSDLDDLLAAEAEAGRRDPYRSVAALLHLVYVRG